MLKCFIWKKVRKKMQVYSEIKSLVSNSTASTSTIQNIYRSFIIYQQQQLNIYLVGLSYCKEKYYEIHILTSIFLIWAHLSP